MELKGIDVSHHNGVINWDKIKAAGVQFAIIRTGYGMQNPTQVDRQFERNYAEAKRVGIPVGAYHYSYATTVKQAEQEADFVISLLKGKRFEFPIYFDIEDKTQAKLSMKLCGDMIKAFCGKLEAANYWAGIYSYDSFFKTNIADDIEKRYAVWVARVENVKPTNVTTYQMWQYSWKGKIDGSSAETDLNVCYVDYPALIKKAKKNGYDKQALYKVTAERSNLTEAQARGLEITLKSLDCVVKVTEIV